MRVGIRELKSRLSQLLALAQQGSVIEITSHDTPIARIIGIAPSTDRGLRRLILTGSMSWNGGKPELGPLVEFAAGGTSLSRMVIEDRE